MNPEKIEVYRQINESQRTFVYFLLAVAGSAIVYGAQRTETRIFSWALLPLALALLLWGLSFYFGYRYTQLLTLIHRSNFDLFEAGEGKLGNVPDSPVTRDMAMDIIRGEIDKNTKAAGACYQFQIKYFTVGGFFFILWHLIEMYLRSR